MSEHQRFILGSKLLAREAAGNIDVARAIVGREVALDDYLAQEDHYTPEAQEGLELYRQRQVMVSELKNQLGIEDPAPLPVETDKK